MQAYRVPWRGRSKISRRRLSEPPTAWFREGWWGGDFHKWCHTRILYIGLSALDCFAPPTELVRLSIEAVLNLPLWYGVCLAHREGVW